MVARRPLTAGIKPPAPPVDPALEHEFVFGKGNAIVANQPIQVRTGTNVARSAFSTKMRADFAEALKRASLERQLNKIHPNKLCEIIEEAIEPWLRSNGYLK